MQQKKQKKIMLAYANGGGALKCSFKNIWRNLTRWRHMSKVYAVPYYPVGAILEFDRKMDMSSIYGGTWELYGVGRMTVGINTSDSDFGTVGKTGGSKTHTQTEQEMPKHFHLFHSDIDGVHDGIYMGAYVKPSSNPANPGIGPKSGTEFPLIYGDRVNSIRTSESGSAQPMNIMNPYVVVYRYRKVAD